jgi:hypothetical protein
MKMGHLKARNGLQHLNMSVTGKIITNMDSVFNTTEMEINMK